jgi:hypothetical protein
VRQEHHFSTTPSLKGAKQAILGYTIFKKVVHYFSKKTFLRVLSQIKTVGLSKNK